MTDRINSVTTFFPSIVSYGITIRSTTSENFPIKGCFLHLYNCVIKCHDKRDDMSAIPLMYWHSNGDIPVNVFNVHTYVSIDAKLFMCKICTYNIKHFFQHTPQCARLACVGSPLIDFPLIDFSQHKLKTNQICFISY